MLYISKSGRRLYCLAMPSFFPFVPNVVHRFLAVSIGVNGYWLSD